MRYQRRFALVTILSLALVPLLAMTAVARPLAQEEPEEQLEIFSWWTSGGEEAALNELFAAFSEQYPDVEIVNAAVAGGAGTAAQPVLQARLQGGDPPDSWQTHPGEELYGRYVDPGFTEPVTHLFEEEGWYDVVPEALIEMSTRDGEIYVVLVGVHRGNELWFNQRLLDEHGIEVGDSMTVDEFFEAAETLQAAGVPALCLGEADQFATAHLFENTLLGSLTPEEYLGLWDGSVSFDDPGVLEAMENLGRMLDYVNPDYTARTWAEAVDLLIEGGCAFNSMGDWAYGEFVAADLTDYEDFGWVNHPGTDGAFMVVSDGFTLPSGAPNPTNAENWLRVVGSADAQIAFNQLKGSIPPRTDISQDEFGPYHQWAMESFANDALVPSEVHGSAAPPGFQQSMQDATTNFAVDRDVEAFAAALVAAQEAELMQ